MSFPNAKDLKKLADSCRKAGIKHFKSGDLEFTLADDAPVSNYKKKTASIASKSSPNVQDNDQIVVEDELTQEQLLMWSVMGNTIGDEPEESLQ